MCVWPCGGRGVMNAFRDTLAMADKLNVPRSIVMRYRRSGNFRVKNISCVKFS